MGAPWPSIRRQIRCAQRRLAQEEEAAVGKRPSPWLAVVVVALFCFQPVAGLGLYVLGRKRRLTGRCA
jgi:hypothetical protein